MALPYNTPLAQQTDINVPSGIRARNPSLRSAAGPRLRPRGLWDGLVVRCWMYFHQFAALSLQLALLLLSQHITNEELFRTDINIKYGCEICSSRISVHVDVSPVHCKATECVKIYRVFQEEL
jgi:hypothetical protein